MRADCRPPLAIAANLKVDEIAARELEAVDVEVDVLAERRIVLLKWRRENRLIDRSTQFDRASERNARCVGYESPPLNSPRMIDDLDRGILAS